MNKNIKAFTLAEVLITLVIIGIIAAITVPAVQANVKKTQLMSQIKSSYSLLNQVFSLALARDGVTLLEDTEICTSINGHSTEGNTDQEAFRKAFSSLLSSMKSYDGYNASEEERVYYKNLDGGFTFSMPYNQSGNGYVIYQTFYLSNGTKIYVSLHKTGQESSYSRNEIVRAGGHMFQSMGNLMFDVNGDKKPNVFGRDLFHVKIGNDGRVYPTNGVDESIYFTGTKDEIWRNNKTCNPNVPMGVDGGQGCLARIIDEGWKMNY